MKVLSLFGGIEAGRVALDKLGIIPESYHSAEFDKYPASVAAHNYPSIVHIGSVLDVNGHDYEGIDLLIGGPPCQDLSIAGKRAGLEGSRSSLFWEYVRILNEAKPKFFLVENVASMPKEARQVMTEALFGIEPVLINSALVSAQNRKRLFWVGKRNEDGTYSKVEVPQPEDKGILLKDILEDIPLTDERWKPLDTKYVEAVSKRIAQFGIAKDKSYGVTATYAGACPRDDFEKSNRTVILGQYRLLNIPRGTNPGCVCEDKTHAMTSSLWEHNNKLVAQFRRSDIRIHADQENCPTLTANMGTGGNNVPVMIGCVGTNSRGNRIYSTDGKGVTVNSQTGGKSGPASNLILGLAHRNRGEGKEPECNGTEKANSLTSVQSDSEVIAILAAKAVNRRVGEDGKRKDDDKTIPLQMRVEPNEDPTKTNTLTTFDKDNAIVAYPQFVWRKLTVRECARLQTFPDTFSFEAVSNSRAYKGIGNSWTVDVISHIFSYLLKD